MTLDHIHALPPGTRLEEYRLDAMLGAGGFGITYRAYDAHLDKFVAIKEYLPLDFATRTEASTVVPYSSADAQDYHWGLTRFLDEARTLARFDHPHLNKVYRFFEGNGTAYMVLEYIRGETLADRLGREPNSGEAALQRLLDEVLSGLAVMHEAGYVHRDIKPANLMLRDEDGSAVVLDFGAARQAVGQRSRPITSILTPGYAPMEQYDGRVDRVGPWTDLYALGMVAYRCISGMRDGELPDAVARKLAQTDGGADLTPAVEAGKGKYSPGLLEAIDWAMEVDGEARPQGVSAWRVALAGGGISRQRTPGPAPRDTAHPAQGGAPPRSGWRGAGMALAAVVVALGVWQGWRMYRGALETGTQQAGTTAQTQAESQTPDTAAPGPDEALADAEVTRLLAAAEADLAARRLTRPAGNNAWEKYRQVLSLSPAHPAAMTGMARVMESYLALFDEALAQGEFDRAAAYLATIRDLNPGSPLLAEGERRLAAARQAEVERQRQAEWERQRQEAVARAREMVSIPGGTFRMGDLSGEGDDDEKPVHSVTVPDFKLGKYEVTFAQWNACVADAGCGSYAPHDNGWGRGNRWDRYSRPVIRVSWDDAQSFISWLNAKTGENFRLPTEAEWEYAARAGSITEYSWGDAIGENRANCNGCGSRWVNWDRRRSAPVGSFPANAWGLHDMHGNVGEWVQDCWTDSYLRAPSNGRARTSGYCGRRVVRGGAWGLTPRDLRSASRGWYARANRNSHGIGLRLAQDK